MPIVLGMAGLDLTKTTEYVPRPMDYFKIHSLSLKQEALVERNIGTFLGWAAAATSFGPV